MGETSIKVTIGGRTYTPNIKKEEKDRVEKAAGLINERMNAFEQAYAVKDKQDLLAMCCLQFATQYLEQEQDRILNSEEVSGKIVSLEKFISDHLDKEK
jgi:cell division protein ZapA (FtsZ GTPase activity inhibitor)